MFLIITIDTTSATNVISHSHSTKVSPSTNDLWSVGCLWMSWDDITKETLNETVHMAYELFGVSAVIFFTSFERSPDLKMAII